MPASACRCLHHARSDGAALVPLGTYRAHVNTIAWSQAGPTKVRIAIAGGPVIVKTVHVRAATP